MNPTELADSLRESLQAFPRYMNRPVKRVHVLTWRLAVEMEDEIPAAPVGGIRYLPASRSAACLAWRKAVADRLRQMRKAGKINLPKYEERTGEYGYV